MPSLRNLIAACAGLALLAAAPSADATECNSNADCATNQQCVKTPCAAMPCEPGTECSEPACPDEGICQDNGPGSSCSEDANCPSGFVCEVVGASGCTAPACEAGQPCPAPPPCEPEEFSACVPAPCTSAGDCGDGLSCITFSYKDCLDEVPAACPQGAECDPMPPASCEETTKSICAPPYIAPCEVDADCGEGFDCKPQEECSCSGGGSTPLPLPTDPDPDPSSSPEKDEAAPDYDPQCSCVPTGTNYCAPKEIECKVDGDCPDSWSCEAGPTEVCVDAPPDGSGDAGDSQCSAPTEPTSFCAPPAWGTWGGGAQGGTNSYAEALSKATGGSAEDVEVTGSSSLIDRDSGCAVAGSDASWLAVLLLGLLLRRRRASHR